MVSWKIYNNLHLECFSSAISYTFEFFVKSKVLDLALIVIMQGFLHKYLVFDVNLLINFKKLPNYWAGTPGYINMYLGDNYIINMGSSGLAGL